MRKSLKVHGLALSPLFLSINFHAKQVKSKKRASRLQMSNQARDGMGR